MIWTPTLQIRKHEYFRDLDFIILFVGIWSLYVINLGVVSLFTDSLFTFLTMLIMLLYLMYSINLNE
ncbi:transmembrane protein, putative [Medicago truncatula]|uniref:Transmembrane protein, putative n=1 Tax=Medicago truncatula TaxID=3880 RepID=G7JRV9_MEDTR|nr:transmembrane protein, putative [Medicago truncatula]